MKTPFALAATILLASCASTGAAKGGNPQAEDQFERLKSLAGEWVVLPAEGLAAGSTVHYRVSSGGSALVESLFPGSEHEMVTVYYKDGPDLVLTHYCSLGNQPHMIAAAGPDPDVIRFRFAGGSNIDPEKDAHMHEAELRFVDAAHVQATWTLYDKGQPGESARFTYVRSWR